MVARAQRVQVDIQADLQRDRFIDWLFNLTAKVGKSTGLSEKESAEALKVIIGEVQREYGGMRPYVHARGRPCKRSAIIQRWVDGFSVSKIAADVGCSEDWVRKVVSDIPGKGKNKRNATHFA